MWRTFGAFVDIGVHQTALVLISMLSETFVKDPRDVVKDWRYCRRQSDGGAIFPRRRISLTMRLVPMSPAPPGEKGRATARPRVSAGRGVAKQSGQDSSGRGHPRLWRAPRAGRWYLANLFANAKTEEALGP